MTIPSFLALSFLIIAGPGPARAGPPEGEAMKSAQRHYLRGLLLERRGALEEALKAYEEALAADPRSAYIGREAAEISIELGQAEKALQWASRVLELEPKSPQSHILMGRAQWAAGDAPAAQAFFEAALKLDPGSAESIFSLGSLLSERSPDKARELLSRFLQQNPDQAAEAHFELAKIELQAGRTRQAREHLKRSIALNPDADSLPARYALAQSYETEHSTDAALQEYLGILRYEPGNVALLNHIGQIHVLRGEWEEMRARFEAAKAAQPEDPTANHWLALYYERAGDLGKAADSLKDSAALKEEPSANMRLSYYLSQAGRLKEAVAALETAHRRWPGNDQIAYFLALGYDDLKQEGEAIKLLREVLALKPDYREARYQLAVLLEKAGRIGEAEAEFRALLAHKPDDASVLNYLGYSLADRGLKLAEAEAMIREAVRLDLKNAAYQDSLGWVHFKQGRSTEAVSELLKAIEMLPEDATVWDHLGDAYEAAGKPASAWRSWKRAVSLEPGQDKSAEKAARLERGFSAEQLGAYYLEHLRLLQGGVQKLSGLCEIQGEILGREFSHSGMVTFSAPDRLEIDVLGPLFSPLFRIRLNAEGFVMDPFHVQGAKPEAVIEAVYTAVSLIREYLSGALFDRRPASYRRPWRARRVEVPGWTLTLDPAGVLAEGLSPRPETDYRLLLEDFGSYQGRRVPRELSLAGKGFTLSFRFAEMKVEAGSAPAGP